MKLITQNKQIRRFHVLRQQYGAWGMVQGALLQTACGVNKALQIFEMDNRALISLYKHLEIVDSELSLKEPARIQWADGISKDLNIPKDSILVTWMGKVFIKKETAEILEKVYPDLKPDPVTFGKGFHAGTYHACKYNQEYYMYE